MALADLFARSYDPSLSRILLTVLYLLVFLLVSQSFASWRRLRHIPGPLSNAFSPWWLLKISLGGRFYIDLKNLADEYGDLVRVGPNEVVTSDIDVLRRMTSAKSPYSRGPWYSTFRFMPGQDHVFSTRDEARHTALKTRLGPGYAGTDVMEAAVDAQVRRFVALIDRKYVSTAREYRPVDFAVITHLFAMDVIGEVTYGGAFGFLDEGRDVFGFLKWNDEVLVTLVVVSTLPWLVKIVHSWPFTLFLPKETDKVGLGRFISAAKKAVTKRFDERTTANGKSSRDMMGQFITQGISKDEAVAEAVLQIVAGTDSVATATRMTLLYLINAPTVFAKLRAELDRAIAEGKISSPIKDSEARQLPYLQAVIKEGLRIFPPATSLGFKSVPSGGDTISGYRLPEGTQVGQNAYGILTSKKYWGEDAELFRPERWLEYDKAELERQSAIFEVLFGMGRYKCLGRPLAFMEMNKLLPELLRRYDFAVVNPPSPLKIFNSGFFMMSGFNLRITRREDDT